MGDTEAWALKSLFNREYLDSQPQRSRLLVVAALPFALPFPFPFLSLFEA